MNAFTSRLLSRVPGIEHAFQDSVTLPPDDLHRLHQIHSASVVCVQDHASEILRSTQADGLFTTTEKRVGVQTGDCLPVLFASSSGAHIAAVHAGWRGVHKGILPNTVALFQKNGVPAKDLVVAMGPAIGPCCFEVSGETLREFETNWKHLWAASTPPWHHSRPTNSNAHRTQAPASENNLWLDLALLARLQLVRAGVSNDRIETVGQCTYCGPGVLASYRRGTHEGVRAGRQWSWIKKS